MLMSHSSVSFLVDNRPVKPEVNLSEPKILLAYGPYSDNRETGKIKFPRID